jgi:hypothetical protein
VSGRPLSLNPALRGKGRAGINGDGRLRIKPAPKGLTGRQMSIITKVPDRGWPVSPKGGGEGGKQDGRDSQGLNRRITGWG